MSERPIAVITGASAGVGRATALAFAEAGYDVALLARGTAGLEGAAADVRRAGARALPLAVDVADWQAVDGAAGRVEDELGPIDVWVNDAMTTVFAGVADTEPHEIARATGVTYLGQVNGTMAALRRMRPRDHGTIVSVGSALAFIAIPLQAAYCGAKFATRGFHGSLLAELRHEGSAVRVCQVHLPAVSTPQFDWCLARTPGRPQPVSPVYLPEEAAAAILRSATTGRPSKVLGVWNTALVVATGLLPGVLQRFAAATTVEGQQADRPLSADRPANLWEPVDEQVDHGAHGAFDDRAGGMLDPSFVRTLPSIAAAVTRAAGASVLDVARRARHRGATRVAPLRGTASVPGA